VPHLRLVPKICDISEDEESKEIPFQEIHVRFKQRIKMDYILKAPLRAFRKYF
jgi:hypothetical protein